MLNPVQGLGREFGEKAQRLPVSIDVDPLVDEVVWAEVRSIPRARTSEEGGRGQGGYAE
jgi:hypothetical protein